MILNHMRKSLKTRIIISTMLISLTSLWLLSFFIYHYVKTDLENSLSDQQFASAGFAANSINQQLVDRFQALQIFANELSDANLTNTKQIKQKLMQKTILTSLFNSFVFIANDKGISIADSRESGKSEGIDYSDRDYIFETLHKGIPVIGKPVIGRTSSLPTFPMAVPIRSNKGVIIGAVAGLTILTKNNFLSAVSDQRYGRTGGYVLISRTHRLIVLSADQSLILKPVPLANSNPDVDFFMSGNEGTRIHMASIGKKMLTSVKKVPITDWVLLTTLPTDEAFAPIQGVLTKVILSTLFLTFVSCLVIWYFVDHGFKPLVSASLALKSTKHQIPISSQDEIGELLSEFNKATLLLSKKNEALHYQDQALRKIIQATRDGFWKVSIDGHLLEVNETYALMSGYSKEELIKMTVPDIEAKESAADTAQHIKKTIAQGGDQFESLHRRKDGSILSVEISAIYFSYGNEKCFFVFIRDITDRKEAKFKSNKHPA